MIRILAISLLCLPILPAAELAIRDVRLGLVNRPADFEFELDTSTVDTSGEDAFDGGLSFEVGGRWSIARTGDSIGAVIGADAAIDRLSYDGSDGLTTLWGRAALGVGWAVSDRITLIGEGLVGYGKSSLSLPATDQADEFEADGTAISYEARISGTWQFTRSFGAGLAAGWLVSSHDLSGDDSELTLDQNGWYAGLIATWRISDAPPALE